MHAQKLFLLTLDSWMGQKVKTFFLKVVMMYIKFKGMERRIPRKQIYVLTHTLDTWGQVIGLTLFSESGHVAYRV